MSEAAPTPPVPSHTHEADGHTDDLLAMAQAVGVYKESSSGESSDSDADLLALPSALGILKDSSGGSRKNTGKVTPLAMRTRTGRRQNGVKILAPRAGEVAANGDKALAHEVDEAMQNERAGAHVITANVRRIRAISKSTEGRLSGAIDPLEVDSATAHVIAGKTIGDLVASHPDEDPAVIAKAAHAVTKASEAAGKHAASEVTNKNKEPISDKERALYKKLAGVIQRRIWDQLDQEEVSEAFRNGGSDAFFELLKERFAANEALRIIAEWMGDGDTPADQPEEPADPVLPTPTSPTTPPSGSDTPRTKPPRRKIGDGTYRIKREPSRALVPLPSTDIEPFHDPAELEPVVEPEKSEDQEKLQQALDEARNTLARLTVEHRARGWSRSGLHEEFNAAEEAYTALLKQVSGEAIDTLRESGLSDNEIRVNVAMAIIEEKALLDRMRYRAVEGSSNKMISQKYKKFCNWWEKQKGAKGFVMKSLVGVGFGVPVGIFTAGTAGLLGVGGIAAGGIVASTRVARGAMISKVSARGSEKHIANDHQDAKRLEDRVLAELGSVDVENMANYATQVQVETNKKRIEADQKANRRRVRQSVAATAVGAVAGTIAGDKLGDWLHNRNGSGEVPSGSGVGTPEAPTPETYGFDPNIIVEQGNGYTHELQQLAATRGISLNSNESFQLYEYLEGRHGGNLLDTIGSYQMGDNYGISSPGSTSWKPEVLRDVNEWLRLNGKAV